MAAPSSTPLLFLFFFLLASSAATAAKFRLRITVDAGGHGDYRRIQDAVDAVPEDNSRAVQILVAPGVYREKVVVPANKPYITLAGKHPKATVVTWGDNGNIHTSPTVTVFASNFVARRLTFQNSHGEGAKAVALRVMGDKVAFYECRILSYQDTLLDETGRHYYKDCYIEGGTDFIFGNGASVFKNCRVHSISNEGGAITAQKRGSPSENTGFYFVNCEITGEKSYLLGRPWGAYSRVVFAHTYMSASLIPYGWDDWDVPQRRSTVYYGEYDCYGPGAKRSKRVSWSRSLTSQEGAMVMNTNAIYGTNWISQ